MSYALGNAASARRYWNRYAKACQGMADEGACLTRAIRHGANVTFSASGLGQTSAQTVASSIQTAANVSEITVQLLRNPEAFASTQAPRVVNALDTYIVSPLVDRAAERATPYFVKYVMPPLAVLYVLSGMAAFFSYKVLEGSRRVSPNRRRRRR
jgi:hypothetical protein